MTDIRANDESAISQLFEQLVDAWNHGDAEAYGALFTADASYTTFVGTQYQGRDDIIRSHRALFSKFLKGTRLIVREQDGAWRIAAFHNTQRQNLKEAISFKFAPDTKPMADRRAGSGRGGKVGA
ncbi:MAG: SgcJ/EcaC family oxidoreductase [Egibacteraceae bacterium]